MLKNLVYGGIVVALLSGIIFLQHKQNERLRADLKTANELVASQQVIIEEVAKVSKADTIIIREVTRAVEEVQNAEGAETLVPPDVASAWADGLDRMCNNGVCEAPERTENPVHGSEPSRDRGADNRSDGSPFASATSCVATLRGPPCFVGAYL